MARLTVHLGGALVAPIAIPSRFPSDWRVRAFVEAGLAVPARQAGHFAASPRTPHLNVVSPAKKRQPHKAGTVL
jgi:hypothetical protein